MNCVALGRRAVNIRATLLCGLALYCAAAIGAGAARAYTGEELARHARIRLSEARAIALTAHPGKITDQELERESGGSGLRYSFDIAAGAATYEVGVDAQTGKVLENSAEGAHND